MEIFQLIASVLSINQHNHELYTTILNRVSFLCAHPGTETSFAERKSQIFKEEKPPLETHAMQGASGGGLPSYKDEEVYNEKPLSNSPSNLNPSAPAYCEKEEEEGKEIRKTSHEHASFPSNNDQPPSYSPLYPTLDQGAQNSKERYAPEAHNVYDDGELPPSYDAESEKPPLIVAFNEQESSDSNPTGLSPPLYDNNEKIPPVVFNESSPLNRPVNRAEVFDMKDAMTKLVQTLLDRFNLSIWVDNEPWFLHSGLNVSKMTLVLTFVMCYTVYSKL